MVEQIEDIFGENDQVCNTYHWYEYLIAPKQIFALLYNVTFDLQGCECQLYIAPNVLYGANK